MSTWPHCRLPALVLPDGQVLTAEPTNLGLYRPDGTRITQRHEVAQLIRQTGKASHSLHTCPPRDDAQRSLFDTQEA